MPNEYTYPQSDYDRPEVLLGTLGSLWAETYMGYADTGSHVRAKGQVENQSIVDLMETINALSRYEVPIFKRDNWYLFRMLESERNQGDFAIPRFTRSTAKYGDGQTRFGQPAAVRGFGWDLPARFETVALVMNRFMAPSLVLHNGSDFTIQDGGIIFNFDPFQDTRVAQRPIYAEGEVVDREAVLWFWRGQWDFEQVYRQFGYVLGMRLKSSRAYRELMNAIFDAIVGGTTRRQIEQALSAVTGVPLVIEPTETVQHVTADKNHRLVITDRHVYKFRMSTMPIVAVGDTVRAGDALVDALRIDEFNRGIMPADLQALAMGRGFLSTCYYGDLVFENKEVPLEVTEAEDDPSGFTRVAFSLGGFPLDVERFFDDIHERGIAKSQQPIDPCDPCPLLRVPGDVCNDIPTVEYCAGTLAHLLDRRPVTNRVGEPVASNLPRTINPLQFLIQNVLRANAALIRIKAGGVDPAGVGLSFAPMIRRIVPPHTAVILSIEMTAEKDSITVEQVTENLTTFTAMEPLHDTATARDARMGIRLISGNCQ